MEIALVSKDSLRIKGKQGTLLVNPTGKIAGANAVILLANAVKPNIGEEGVVIIQGPGEYEVAGIKITGIRTSDETIFSLIIDKVEIVLGRGEVLEKDHTKLKEHNIVLMYNIAEIDPSFITAFAPNAVMLYGEKAEETITKLAKEGFRKEQKYVTTAEKLPQEMEAILLS